MLELANAIDADRARAQERLLRARFAAASAELAAAVLLATALPAVAEPVTADPSLMPELPPLPRDLTEAARDAAGLDGHAHLRALRRLARRERARIALRQLLPPRLGGADVEQAARELSALAEACIGAAFEEATRAVFARFGRPVAVDGRPGELVVLGMGKLGGGELNAGSDVDLVCFYDSDQASARGSDGVERSAHEIWSKVVQRLTASLETATEDGLVWPVDLRLRPEGSRGPLVNSLAAAERYYETFGRLWERAALLRARPVAGDAALGARALATLTPFVWTRRVDPGVGAAMYALVRRAREERSASAGRDLKLGPGGIREAEMFVQTLQLVWGGRDERLRVRPTLEAVERLRAAGLCTDREAADLEAAYLVLRRAEHAVQLASGRQTHCLPARGPDLERLARVLGHASAAALEDDLERHATRVEALFASLLPEAEVHRSRWDEAYGCLDRSDVAAFAAAVRAAGMPAVGDDGELERELFDLGRDPRWPLGAGARERSRALADALLDALADAADPLQAAHCLRRLVGRLPHPEIYGGLLRGDAAALRRLVTVLGGSAFVGDAVATQPDLADQVLFEHHVPTPADARAEVERALGAPGDGGDAEERLERRIGALRRAQRRITTAVALADLGGDLDTRGATLVLSALADAELEAATRLALGVEGDAPVRGLAVVAMGKLGGREIGYGSDLDVLFVYDGAHAPAGDPLDHFSRRARRIIQLVSTPHAEGMGYELDTRLRPSGNQGMLVVSVDAFARYHGVLRAGGAATGPPSGAPMPRAAVWERLALLRARPCAGDALLSEELATLVEAAAYDAPTDPVEAAAEVARLRARIERELARERPGRHDVKHGRGGIVEIEFTTQLLQLVHGHDPRVRTTDTLLALDALARIGALQDHHAAALREGYAFLRRLEQRMRVVHGDAAELIEEQAVGLGPLARRMGMRDGPRSGAVATLLETYRAVTTRVRRSFEQIVLGSA
jgi:glutamate-ammonia-ligase adenylyltransferase